MTDSIENRIRTLQKGIDEWLSPGNYTLKEAIDKTVQERHFSFDDIKYQLRALRKTLKSGEFTRWVMKAELGFVDIPKTVICLHAGNLPLVGIQDILAVALSGHRYVGKISRKDPYLPVTLLNILKEREIINGDWSLHLQDLEKFKADGVMFSGSTSSAESALEKLTELNIISEKTPRLIRTAHYSIALIEDDKPDTMTQLAEAVLRYGGKGCRSVAMVVAPYSLNSKKCSFTDYVESFWLHQPQHEKAPSSLYHRYAYNKSAGIQQAWLDDFLIEESAMEPGEPFILHWVKGDRQTIVELSNNYQHGLQTIYVTDPSVEIPGLPFIPELLIDAQQPPVWWKPDGKDPLKWLATL